MNVLPFLTVRETLPTGSCLSRQVYFAVPAIIAVYLVCGSLILFLGQSFGLSGAENFFESHDGQPE
jgi:hypothetical protein